MSDLQCYTETWRKAHCPYFLCFSNTWRMSYLQSVQNQCILHKSLRRLKLLKYLENVIFARKCHMCHSPGLTRSQLNKCHKSYNNNNNNTVLAWLKLSYMPRSGYLGVNKTTLFQIYCEFSLNQCHYSPDSHRLAPWPCAAWSQCLCPKLTRPRIDICRVEN